MPEPVFATDLHSRITGTVTAAAHSGSSGPNRWARDQKVAGIGRINVGR